MTSDAIDRLAPLHAPGPGSRPPRLLARGLLERHRRRADPGAGHARSGRDADAAYADPGHAGTLRSWRGRDAHQRRPGHHGRPGRRCRHRGLPGRHRGGASGQPDEGMSVEPGTIKVASVDATTLRLTWVDYPIDNDLTLYVYREDGGFRLVLIQPEPTGPTDAMGSDRELLLTFRRRHRGAGHRGVAPERDRHPERMTAEAACYRWAWPNLLIRGRGTRHPLGRIADRPRRRDPRRARQLTSQADRAVRGIPRAPAIAPSIPAAP